MSVPSVRMWLWSGDWGNALRTLGWSYSVHGDITNRNIWRFTPTYI